MSYEVFPIKHFALGIYDGPHATPKESDSGPIFLGINNVSPEGHLDLTNIKHISEQEFGRWTKRVLPRPDDIVFSYEATLHRYVLIPKGFRGCLGRRMALIRPDTSKTDPRFLHYYLLSPIWRGLIEGKIVSGATVDRIPLKSFPDFNVALPPLNTQRRISSILSAYDDLIDNNRKRIVLLEKAARLLYDEWFVRLQFPGHEHTPMVDGVPKEWKSGTIGSFFNTASGGTPSRAKESYYTGSYNWVKTKELNNNFIFDTEEKITEEAIKDSAAKLFPKQTILVAMYGATIGELGILGVKSATNQACCAILPTEGISYVYTYLFFLNQKEKLISLSMGAAQKNVSQQIIRSMPMMLPKKGVLSVFSAIVEPIFEQLRVLQIQTEKLQTARDLLLPRLMSGELAV